MRILHVLSANFFAGSVAYAVQLAEAHRAQGHAVWMISDANQLPTGATQVHSPISNRRYGQRLRNSWQIRQVVKANNIDVVHAHSRAASWVSYVALRGLRVPLVSTVHGRQHLHASTSLFDIYGDKVIAICANLRQHLVSEVEMAAGKIAEVPNGIAFAPADAAAPAACADEPPRLSFIGRFNGGKGERAAALLQQVFPTLLQDFSALRVALIGGELEHLPAAGKAALARLQADYGERMEVIGFTRDVPAWLQRSTVVVGAGRVAIEALGAGCPVLALGEASYAGVVSDAAFETAAASNFGDISAQQSPNTVDFAAVLRDARTFLQVPQAVGPELQQRVQTHYSLAGVAARVMEIYQEACTRRK